MLTLTTNAPRLVITSLAFATFLTLSASALAGAGHGPAKGEPQNQGHMMGAQGGDSHGPAGHHGMEIGAPGKAADVTRTIDVAMHDNYYKPEQITVKAGETIRFKITNKGEFLHEFGLGTAVMHKAHQKEMMKMWEHGMIEADRINRDKMMMDHGDGRGMKHDDPNSILLEPGKSGEVIWKFSKPVDLEFACNIPGHYESGMMGPIKFK